MLEVESETDDDSFELCVAAAAAAGDARVGECQELDAHEDARERVEAVE